MHTRWRWLLDFGAICVLLAYGWTTRHTEQGAADPIWSDMQQRGVLRVGTDPGFQPFAQTDGTTLRGYDVDLVNEIGRRLGLRVEWTPLAYDALYDALSTRHVDLLAAALPLAPEQGWRAHFSTPYLNAGQVLVVPRGSAIENAAQLAGRSVGVALGSDGDTWVRNLGRTQPDVHRAQFDTIDAALEALRANQTDAVVTDAVSAIAATNAQAELAIAPTALTVEPYVLATPIEGYQLQREINRALDDMRQEGVFDQLNARWFQPRLVR